MYRIGRVAGPGGKGPGVSSPPWIFPGPRDSLRNSFQVSKTCEEPTVVFLFFFFVLLTKRPPERARRSVRAVSRVLKRRRFSQFSRQFFYSLTAKKTAEKPLKTAFRLAPLFLHNFENDDRREVLGGIMDNAV